MMCTFLMNSLKIKTERPTKRGKIKIKDIMFLKVVQKQINLNKKGHEMA